MIISYDGPPDFGNETIAIKIELQPSEVADVVRNLISPGTARFLPEDLRGISTRELVEKVRDAAHNGLFTLTDVRLIQDVIADWCRINNFAVSPSTGPVTQ